MKTEGDSFGAVDDRAHGQTERPATGGVVVTGDHGFVGRYLVAALAPRAAWCVGIDRVVGEPRAYTRHYTVDLTDAEATRAAFASAIGELGAPDWVIHLAAQASVGDSFRDPFSTYRVNVLGTAAVLQAVADLAPAARVLIPSSAHVYGPPARRDGVLDETVPTRPTTHYGVSKLVQEEMARVFRETRGLACLVTRAFNHTGPGQTLGFVLPDLARRLAVLERAGGGALRIGNLAARRDYLDVRDVVQAYLMVLGKGDPATIYNVAAGNGWSVQEILDELLTQVRGPVTVQPDPALFRPVDIPVLVGDASRLRALGWQPRYDIRDTIRDTLDYWRRRVAEEEPTPS